MTDGVAATPPATRPATLLEDLLEVFYAPSRVFARREGKNWFAPLAIYVVLSIVLYFATRDLLQPVFDAEWTRNSAAILKKNPQLTPDQMAGFKAQGQRFAVVGIAIFSLVVPMLTGLVLWLVGKGVGAKQTLNAAMNVGVLAFLPRLLGMIVAAILAMVLPEEVIRSQFSVTLGVGHFLPAGASALAYAFFGRIELFVLWTTVLLAIGLRVTGRTTRGQAAIAAAVVWLIGALPGVLGALRAG